MTANGQQEFFELHKQHPEYDSEEARLCDNPSFSCSTVIDEDQNQVDFVLVWDDKSQPATQQRSVLRRQVFEDNLRNEGLELEYEPTKLGNSLHFIKIRAPNQVLMRYAEILKLRLPMKKFDHIKEITIESVRVPIFTDVVVGVQGWISTILTNFMYDERKFKTRKNELTATFSRDKVYLFDTERPDFFTQSIRSRIIEFILKRKRLSKDENDDFAFGIDRALNEGIYSAAYPLHDGSIKTKGSARHQLCVEWASFRKMFNFQPLDAVRDYFGVKIALYFAWLGFYTNLLIVPSIVGLLSFLYGVISLNYDIPSQELCAPYKDNETVIKMCPACDHFCEYWDLKETCLYSKVMYLFDNESTVFFAVFMSFWAALFLEFWKKYSREITHRWDVTGFTPEEEHARPEYLERLKNVEEFTVNFVTQTKEPKVPFWSRKVPGVVVSISAVLLMVLLVLTAVFGVILYRMSMVAALSLVDQDSIKSNANLFISATGATINLVCILIVNQIYGYVAEWLTELELNRTQNEFDDSMSLKIYLLQFVNYYSSIFYIAFFKGKFIGRPGNYNRLFNHRQEECSPGGCYMEVCLQMAIIFVGKQFFLSIVEYHLPRLWKLYNSLKVSDDGKEHHPQWEKDFKLVEWGKQTLFYEYLEMVIQYGFITIFVSAFPLAPLFALFNNIFELRVDAKKLLFHHRRPVALRVRDIGIWLHIMESLGRIAVFTNAFIIAFTSEFIPKLVYKYRYGNMSLFGYTNFTLSVFDPNDFGEFINKGIKNHPEECRYYDFRYPPSDPSRKYQIREDYWHILAARLAFVVVFQNFVALSVMAIKWIVPNMSGDIRERIRREAYLTNEIIIRTELLKAKGQLNLEEIMDPDSRHNPVYANPVESKSRTVSRDDSQHDAGEEEEDASGNTLSVRNRRVRRYSMKGDTGDVTDTHIVV